MASFVTGIFVYGKNTEATILQAHFEALETHLSLRQKVGRLSKDIDELSVLLNRYIQDDHNHINQSLTRVIARFERQTKQLCLGTLRSDICQPLNQAHKNIDAFALAANRSDLEGPRRALIAINQDINEFLSDDLYQTHQILNTRLLALHAKLSGLIILAGCIILCMLFWVADLFSRPLQQLHQKLYLMNTGEVYNLQKSDGYVPHKFMHFETDLLRLYQQNNKLEAVKNTLLRHASHELKTPLASINEGCNLLAEEVVGPLNPAQKEVVGLLSKGTQRLNSLVHHLLDYNSLLQQSTPQYQVLDLPQIIHKVSQTHELALQAMDMKVVVHCEVPYMKTDDELLQRILDNLFSNAIAHGAKHSKIDIHIHLVLTKCCIDFANQGRVITDEQKATLFEPFSRGEHQRNDSVVGAGLGLSIVDECVRLLKGTISLVDVSYAPICFRILLPNEGIRAEHTKDIYENSISR